MKTAVIDTETSGIFDFKQPADAPGQPRLANLAIILIDESFEPVGEIDNLIKPGGWTLTPEAAAVNGLTEARLMAEGIDILGVLKNYSGLIAEGYVIASYNAQFDTKIMRGELRRAGLPDLFEKTPNVCLMRASTDICKLPGKRGFKFPKLSEACAFFKLEPEPMPHTALNGARKAAEILRALHALKALPEPEVHYAKNVPVGAPAPAKPAAAKEEAY